MKSMSTGKMSSGRKVAIVSVNRTNDNGSFTDPPEQEFWVVVLGTNPMEVLSHGHATYQDAVDWIAENGLRLGASPD